MNRIKQKQKQKKKHPNFSGRKNKSSKDNTEENNNNNSQEYTYILVYQFFQVHTPIYLKSNIQFLPHKKKEENQIIVRSTSDKLL